MAIGDYLQELRELGLGGSIFRIGWELKMRAGFMNRPVAVASIDEGRYRDDWIDKIPFADPLKVADALRDRIPADDLARLSSIADDAIKGKILCFGRWSADYGDPIDWHLNPTNGRQWNSSVHWSRALEEQNVVGDVKLTWEAARFPQAYHMARDAAFNPHDADRYGSAIAFQIDEFIKASPFGFGIHWHSSQEIVFRLIAWLFALRAMSRITVGDNVAIEKRAAQEIVRAAAHIERQIDYARRAVYNNHLLSEALGLLIAGSLFPSIEESARRRNLGRAILDEQSERQFYKDGAYIQQSHNYHRTALQDLFLAWIFTEAAGEKPPENWRRAIERSLDFLIAHQNPSDGRLPNYGANDGAQPMILSMCDYSDFRPDLQAASIIARGERVYEPGPWDEAAAWLLGPKALDAPLRRPQRSSISFADTGHHVLRGNEEGNFGMFRCGSIKDRFSQIDMLHLDIWRRGLNALTDGGSFLYNGPQQWHNHFMRTESHNTVSVDGLDQMRHHRRFKCLYWTKAKLLQFEDRGEYVICAGEHYGYERHPGRCVHRRSILFLKDDLWIAADTITGSGEHAVRLQWLCGDFPYEYCRNEGRLRLAMPHERFTVSVYDADGMPIAGDVAYGSESPARGWLSRYYGEKIAAPSLAIEKRGKLPITFISVIGAGEPRVFCQRGVWSANDLRFYIRDGMILTAESIGAVEI